MRPHTTIVLAEKQFKFPFDLNHLVIRSYEHLGTGIDYEEAERLKREIVTAISTIMDKQDVDSPVYTFLPDLQPPSIEAAARASWTSRVGPAAGSKRRPRRRRRPARSSHRCSTCSARPERERLGSGARVSREAARDHPRRSVSDPAACTGDLQERAAERA